MYLHDLGRISPEKKKVVYWTLLVFWVLYGQDKRIGQKILPWSFLSVVVDLVDRAAFGSSEIMQQALGDRLRHNISAERCSIDRQADIER